MEHHALCIILERSKPHDHVNFLNFSKCNVLLFQGRGSYEDRTEMLRLIVDLVEASIYADNPEWRL